MDLAGYSLDVAHVHNLRLFEDFNGDLLSCRLMGGKLNLAESPLSERLFEDIRSKTFAFLLLIRSAKVDWG